MGEGVESGINGEAYGASHLKVVNEMVVSSLHFLMKIFVFSSFLLQVIVI